jgi:succinyl-diaminopimelate desuccinylase
MTDKRDSDMTRKELVEAIDAQRDTIIQGLCSMLAVKALGPESGGAGEWERAQYIAALAERLGLLDIEFRDSPDSRVPSGKRPNIIIRVPGRTSKQLWVVTHMDTVPEGDIESWNTPPYEATVADGKIFGRGAEDNGQELIASLFALASLVRGGIVPELSVGLVFVSDEETGNEHGIEFLLREGIFRKGDLVIVPDHGIMDGSEIEVVEKGIAWIGAEVHGRQTHASTPHKGINALEAASHFIVAASEHLRAKYSATDELFDPPRSTFEPTRCESNGPNINTVPGKQLFAFDFRVLPEYSLTDIMDDLREVASNVESSTGAKIHLDFIQRADSAPRTDVGSEVVQRLSSAIAEIRGKPPRPVGIGGGTCATPFRREGIEAAVWASTAETAHDANEYCVIENLISDTKVYALLFAGR